MDDFALDFKIHTVITDDYESTLQEVEKIRFQNDGARITVATKVVSVVTVTELQYYHDTTVGLWCIDQDPKDVNIEWIRANAFQLKPIDSDS